MKAPLALKSCLQVGHLLHGSLLGVSLTDVHIQFLNFETSFQETDKVLYLILINVRLQDWSRRPARRQTDGRQDGRGPRRLPEGARRRVRRRQGGRRGAGLGAHGVQGRLRQGQDRTVKRRTITGSFCCVAVYEKYVIKNLKSSKLQRRFSLVNMLTNREHGQESLKWTNSSGMKNVAGCDLEVLLLRA